MTATDHNTFAGSDVNRISIWSGPRNISTALMYSFRERADTTVVDEPLYAHYLATTGIWHPGTDDTLASQENDGTVVVENEILGPSPTPVLFFKQMAHHLVNIDWSFLDKMNNVILTRHPAYVLASFSKNVSDVNADTTGLPNCIRILDRVLDAGASPIVIDSKQLLLDPERVLTRLCEALGIDFDSAMLSWDDGAVPEDGVWGEIWYAATHRSTGFAPYVDKDVDLPPAIQTVVDECLPMYDRLLGHAITADK